MTRRLEEAARPDLQSPGSGMVMARTLRRGLSGVSALAVLVSIIFSTSLASAASPATVDVTANATFGMVLTDAQGFTLYSFPSDHNGISTCTGSCLSVWPALTVPTGTTPTAEPGVSGTVSGCYNQMARIK